MRPRIYPFKIEIINETYELFSLFLPVKRLRDQSTMKYELWFHDFMKNWEVSDHPWEVNLMKLITDLAWNNIGYIDWNPYIPIMFTKFIRFLKLPIAYRFENKGDNCSFLQVKDIATWIVSILVNLLILIIYNKSQ